MYDASSRKDIRRAEKAAAIAESQRIQFLRMSLASIEGRAWFYDILTACHMFNDPFTGEALREAYSKGERNIGLRIYADILANCPDQLVLMMREATEKDNDRRSPTNTAASPEYGGGEDAGWDADRSAEDDAE